MDELLSGGQEGAPLLAALPVNVLEQAVERLHREVEQAREREAALLDQLTMQVRNEKNLEQVLADVRKTNLDLVSLRDKVERDLDRQLETEQSQHPATKTALRELEREIATLKKHRATGAATAPARPTTTPASAHPPQTAPPARTPGDRHASAEPVVEVVAAAYDPALVADMIRSTGAALRRYHAASASIASEDAQPLYDALTDLIATGDVPLISRVVHACAVALERVRDTAALPARHEATLQEALVAFSAAIKLTNFYTTASIATGTGLFGSAANVKRYSLEKYASQFTFGNNH